MSAALEPAKPAAASAPLTFGRRRPERVWDVPVELVIALTRSAYGEVIRRRATSGDVPMPAAKVWIHDKHFFAQIDFLDGRPTLVLQLAAWPWENDGASGGGDAP